jgi:hypothetical protein
MEQATQAFDPTAVSGFTVFGAVISGFLLLLIVLMPWNAWRTALNTQACRRELHYLWLLIEKIVEEEAPAEKSDAAATIHGHMRDQRP